MLKTRNMEDFLSKDDINKLITLRMQGSRPVAWEEDISRNTLDTEPFNNLPPVTELDSSEFENPNRLRLIEPLLGDAKLEDLIARDPYPIPCADDREKYSPGYDGVYWLSGLEDYLKIMDVVKRYGVQPRSVFDFGCASGRVIRHFAAQSDIPEIWGSDINARHIRWLYEHMPHTVKPIFNHCIPTLPIRDNSVDVITAFSVFTHIDTFETCWLAELRRIMHDDGVAYLTVHNEDTWRVLRDQVDNEKNRLVQSLLSSDPSVREKLQSPLPDTRTVYRFMESGPYRAQVFHSNNYLHQVWGRFFKIEEILPGHHVRQTVLVLRKR
jgi:ubiquinone/menaquinone biosynthesis C-methylase UbiE